jgi:ribosome-associated toxin RatA of RatAB toxin-antitoxin module
MSQGTVQRIEIPASAGEIFAVLVDLERYPEWISAMRKVEVLERDPDGLPSRVQFEVDAMVKVISYVLDYSYESPHKMEWVAEPSDDIREMIGSYELYDLDGGGTDVVYALRVDYAFPLPGFLRRQAEKQLVSTALRGLAKRVRRLQTE